MEWINYTLFTIGHDTPVLLIDLITSVLGLSCVFLAGRKSAVNFWVGYLYSAALFLMFWNKSLYASLLLQPVSLIINMVGHYRWTHPRDGEQSSTDAFALKVSALSWAGRGLCVLSVVLVSALWGWTLDKLFPSDPHPYLDTLVTVLILVAQLLSALKKWDCWIAWILVNIAQLALHLSVGHVFMPVVCTLYLANAIWSLVSWTKSIKKGE